MPYYHDRYGKLSFLPPVRRNITDIGSSGGRRALKADIIRLPHIYVESTHNMEPGQLVAWTGDPHMFKTNGTKKEEWSSIDGYEYALSRVEPASDSSAVIAGIVQEKAAEPGQSRFTHKGIHTTHALPSNNQYVYRVARDVTLAWVFDDHENELEGVYNRYVNGELDTTGPYQIQMVSSDTFAIDRTMAASLENELADLRARFNNLTTK